ncbi:MAG: hypothetical protein PHE27_02550 [Alphaproteobacteria bacterium]|nr:hypothetical protein [Alphaproteobacteria bacterium]
MKSEEMRPCCIVGGIALFAVILAVCYLWYATPGSVYVCEPGRVLAGIKDGKPVCAALSCRQVSATNNLNSRRGISMASCADDEILTGGGGESEVPGSSLCHGRNGGFIHTNKPDKNGWVVDGYSSNWGEDICTSSVAICCKFVTE